MENKIPITEGDLKGYFLIERAEGSELLNIEIKYCRDHLDNKRCEKFMNFINSKLDTDELWEYDSCAFLAGSFGYAIVRDGKVLNYLAMGMH